MNNVTQFSFVIFTKLESIHVYYSPSGAIPSSQARERKNKGTKTSNMAT